METATATPPVKHQFDENAIESFRVNFLSKLKFRAMLFAVLPMGFKSRMWIKKFTRETCEVVVPYNRRNKNPFNSTFWAVLGMGAEMASGSFITMFSRNQKPSVATIVVESNATYSKKAVGNTTFVCNAGPEIEAAFKETIATGEPVTVAAPTTGYNDAGEVVCEWVFVWSLKRRSSKK